MMPVQQWAEGKIQQMRLAFTQQPIPTVNDIRLHLGLDRIEGADKPLTRIPEFLRKELYESHRIME